MAHAYETFATGGLRVTGSLGAGKKGPVGIRKVTFRSSGEVWKRNKRIRKRILPRNVADTTTSILETVVKVGTGKVASLGGARVWGKTGTTENYGDAWFVGSTDKLTIAVWVGYPERPQADADGVPRRARGGRHVPGADLARLRLASINADKQRLERQCAIEQAKLDKAKLDQEPGEEPATPPPPPASCVKAGVARDPNASSPTTAGPAAGAAGADATTTTPTDDGDAPATEQGDGGGGDPATPPADPVPPAAQAPAPAPAPETVTPGGGATPSGGAAPTP